MPVGNWNRSAFWITNYRGFARSALSRKSGAAPLLTYPVAASLFLKDRLAHRTVRVSLRVNFEQGFDGIDIFWNQLRERKRELLLGARSREILDWHFRYPMQRKQLYILSIMDRDQLIAYSIFYRKDKPNTDSSESGWWIINRSTITHPRSPRCSRAC